MLVIRDLFLIRHPERNEPNKYKNDIFVESSRPSQPEKWLFVQIQL